MSKYVCRQAGRASANCEARERGEEEEGEKRERRDARTDEPRVHEQLDDVDIDDLERLGLGLGDVDELVRLAVAGDL